MAGFFLSMRFQKPPLSYEQQADLVLGRGLVADRTRLIRRLRSVGYYRLCGYWHHLRQPDESFRPGSDFDLVWKTYNFDRRLRMVVMEAIERVEVAFRCDVYTELVMRHGPFCHREPRHFPNARPGQHAEMLERVRQEARRSREPFVLHFKNKYDEFPDLPLWAVAQIISFGTVLTLLNMSESDIRPAIAARFGYRDTVFASWLLTLNLVRNICAHHSRLWNRELGLKPLIPNRKHGPDWHGRIAINNNRIFVVLTMLYLLQKQIAPRSQWRERVFALFDSFPSIPLAPMGMPQDWRRHPLWQ
jgi:abortive infection bacteriophage resistance protein